MLTYAARILTVAALLLGTQLVTAPDAAAQCAV